MSDTVEIAKDVTGIVNKGIGGNPVIFITLVVVLVFAFIHWSDRAASDKQMDKQNDILNRHNDLLTQLTQSVNQLAQNSSMSNQKLEKISEILARVEKHQEESYYRFKK